jgi:diamine N-acetyltransferase
MSHIAEKREFRLKNGGTVRLGGIDEESFFKACALRVSDEQKGFVAPPVGVIARGYLYRDCGARVFTILLDEKVVGLALVREFTDEPLGYDLQQFLIDKEYQNMGCGTAALGLILGVLRDEGKYPCVEVCVKKADAAALHVYEKAGFADSGYTDPDCPDSLNLILRLQAEEEMEGKK